MSWKSGEKLMKIHLRDNWSKRLDRIRSNLDDMEPAWKFVGEFMKKRVIKDCFDKNQSPDGKPWLKWSPQYRKRMEKRGKGGNKILQDRGELRKITYQAFKDHVIVGTEAPYAAAHQFGTKANSKHGRIPARPFLGFTEQDKVEVQEILMRHIKKKG